MKQEWISRGTLALSVLTHAWVIAAAPAPHPRPSKRPPLEMALFTPVEEAPPEPEVLPPEVPPPLPEPVKQIEPLEVPVDQPAAPEAEAEPAEATTAPELTGTTLLAEGESGFGAPAGSGNARNGAVGLGKHRVAAKVAPKAVAQSAPRPAEAPVIPLAQLSRRPVPPALGAALERNYPPSARRQGKSGEAQVRARLDPKGRIIETFLAGESAPEFGAACQKTLRESKWSAPLDAGGKAVGTWVSYRCKFRIDD